ncbi:hypothetical protein Avbf_04469 [Armadillidium vulgare]|nr:hypothetical protein Avbf_04469 [Armadillidium vulgare]
MRDFHVSPAMGTEEASVSPPIEESKVESPDDASAMDRIEKEISLLNVQGYQDKFFPKDSNNLQGLLSVNTLKGNSKTGLTCQDGKSNSSKPSKSTCKDTKKLKSESEVKNIPPVTVSTISELSSPQPKKETETQKKENKESAKDIIKETPPKSEIVVKQSILSQNKECISQTRQQLGERDSSLFKTEKNLIPSSIKTGKYQSSFQNPPSKSEVVKPTALRIDSCSKSKQALPNPSIARPRPQGITPTTAKIPSITPITFKQPLEQRELQNTEIIRKPKIPQKLDPTNKP